MLVLLKRDVKLQLTNYHVSSEKCEIEGIILGLEVVIRLIVEGHGQGHNACTYILCDCQKAIDVFTVHSEFQKYSEIWERVLLICDKLVDSSYEVKLVKIPGHSDINVSVSAIDVSCPSLYLIY